MKKADQGEYFVSSQENKFTEYKVFTAERYYLPEQANPPAEEIRVSESFPEQSANATQGSRTRARDDSGMREEYERLNNVETSTTSPSATANSSVQAGSGSSAQGAGAASATSAASVGISSAAALVVAIVVIASTIFSFIGNFITFFVGADFLSISVDINSIIAGDESFRGLSYSNFYLELTDDKQTTTIPISDGNQTYLITDLNPQTTYTYNLVCNNTNYGSTSVCYTGTVTTSSDTQPIGVADDAQTYITLDEQTKTATLNYSIYLSDIDDKLQYSIFYVSTSPYIDKETVDMLAVQEDIDEQGFFRGTVEGITSDKVYMYVVGYISDETDEALFTEAVVYRGELQTNIPDEWIPELFVADESSVDYNYAPNQISINGLFTSIDENVAFFATVTQYDSNGLLLSEEEYPVSIDVGSMRFAINASACYGVANYSYVIVAYVPNQVPAQVFESKTITFSRSQDFAAEYTRVQPADATITYNDYGFEFSLSNNFTSEYENYYFSLTVTDVDGNVLTEINSLKSNAVFTIDKTKTTVNFIYKDCGSFADGEVVYNTYECEAITLSYPTATLSADYGWDGEHFTLDLQIDSQDDLTQANAVIVVTNDSGRYEKTVYAPETSQTVVLDNVEGEIGAANVEVILNLVGDSTGQDIQTLTLDSANYQMNYDFEVARVAAFMADETHATVSVDIVTNPVRIPSTYKVWVSESTTNHSGWMPVSETTYTFDEISVEQEGQITVTVTDQNDNQWGTPFTYTISGTQAKSALTEIPSLNAVNPGDSVITYNDDGTVNLYRNIDFSCTQQNVYCNARLYSQVSDDDETIEYIDCFTNEKYAVLENIAEQSYFFTYYYAVELDNVMYTVAEYQYPSGAILEYYENTATVEKSDEKTIITIMFGNSAVIENKVYINGIEYAFDEEPDMGVTTATITLQGNVEVASITVNMSPYANNYEDYLINGDVQMKGNRFKTTTIGVS